MIKEFNFLDDEEEELSTLKKHTPVFGKQNSETEWTRELNARSLV